MIQDSDLQPLINKLHSAAAKSYVQQTLKGIYDESAVQDEPVALTQEQVRRQTVLMSKSRGAGLRGKQPVNQKEMLESMGPLADESMMLNISEVPEETVPYDCVPTNKCTLGKGSCPKIRDRFLNIQAGIMDMLTKLKNELAELQRTCEEDRVNMEAQIANLGEKLRGAQEDLAVSTKGQVDSESSSNLKATQHEELTHEYGTTMKDCCDEQNELKSEICALEKVRGELYRLRGLDVFIIDCEVGKWEEGKCSVSCGGGYLTKTRSILTHPYKGMACPPLELKESCNTHPCPIDCVVGEWEGWSGCSAECGGGVRKRQRSVVTEMKYGGEPCEDTEESEACNGQSCNAPCELAEWSEWDTCSQACWTGTERRDRGVAEPARGTGKCEDPAGHHRLQFRECNKKPCTEFYHLSDDGKYLQCGSKVDLMVLMDGSGSLGDRGWSASQKFVTNLISHLEGGDDEVHVALQLFSGPRTWDSYYKCTGAGSEAPDMEKDCGT